MGYCVSVLDTLNEHIRRKHLRLLSIYTFDICTLRLCMAYGQLQKNWREFNRLLCRFTVVLLFQQEVKICCATWHCVFQYWARKNHQCSLYAKLMGSIHHTARIYSIMVIRDTKQAFRLITDRSETVLEKAKGGSEDDVEKWIQARLPVASDASHHLHSSQMGKLCNNLNLSTFNVNKNFNFFTGLSTNRQIYTYFVIMQYVCLGIVG